MASAFPKKPTRAVHLLCLFCFLAAAHALRAEPPFHSSLATYPLPAVSLIPAYPIAVQFDVAFDALDPVPGAGGSSIASPDLRWADSLTAPSTLRGLGIRASLPEAPGVAPKTRFLLRHQFGEGPSPGYPNEINFGSSPLLSWLKGGRTLYAADLDSAHVDVNLRGSRTLAALAAEHKVRGWSASVSQSIHPNWRLSAELCGSYRNRAETPETSSLLSAAATYAIGKRLTFDAGVARRLSHTFPDTTVFFAVTMPLDASNR